MTDRELMQMALDALEEAKGEIADWGAYASEYFQNKHDLNGSINQFDSLIEALRARLAQREPEPYGYIARRNWKMPVFIEANNVEATGLPYNNPDYEPVFKAPPQREWQGLTDEEKSEIYNKNYNLYAHDMHIGDFFLIQQAIEAKLKEKNK